MPNMRRQRSLWHLVGSLFFVLLFTPGVGLANSRSNETALITHKEIPSGRSQALAQLADLSVPDVTALGYQWLGGTGIRRDEIWQALAGHPAPNWDVMRAIISASARTGIDLGLLMAIAWKESVFLPNAASQNSSARGLFQFTTQTWREALEQHGSRLGLPKPSTARPQQQALIDNKRFDPVIAALVAAEMIRSNGESLARSLGGPITQTEAFLTHFLGRSGAERFLRAVYTTPNCDVRDVIPAAFANNRARFPQGQGPITVRASYEHLLNILESRRSLYLQILRLEALLYKIVDKELMFEIR
jgi:hypothetical protein